MAALIKGQNPATYRFPCPQVRGWSPPGYRLRHDGGGLSHHGLNLKFGRSKKEHRVF